MTAIEKTVALLNTMPPAKVELVYNFAMSVNNRLTDKARSKEDMLAALEGMRNVWAGHETELSFDEMKHGAMKERYALAD